MDISGTETNAMDIGENQGATNENIIPDASPQDFFGQLFQQLGGRDIIHNDSSSTPFSIYMGVGQRRSSPRTAISAPTGIISRVNEIMNILPTLNTSSSNIGHRRASVLPPPPPPINIPIANRLSNVIAQSLRDKPKYKKVISEEGLETIAYKIYKEEEEVEKQTCAITREEFEDGEEIAILPCRHVFNKEAILTWLQKKSAECPICRKVFSSIEVREGESEGEAADELENQDDFIIPRFRNMRQILVNLIDDRIQEEDDYNIQQAIIASLRDN